MVVSSRRKDHVDKAIKLLQDKGIAASGLVCHVAQAADRENLIKHALDKYGAIDILINNAGVNPAFGPIIDATESAWDKVFEVNLKAGFLLSREVAKLMAKRGGGTIVFVSSYTGLKPAAGLGVYSVTKTAMLGLTRTLASEWVGMNIRVNAVCPGVIKTDFSSLLWKEEDGGAGEALKARIPMGRFGRSEDVAGAVAFLVSDDSTYITGEAILMDGGLARL